MFDRVFSAALTFCLLAAGTLAVGSAMLEQPKAEAARVVYLPKVEVSGKRVATAQVAQAEASQHLN
jgi:hypothetical protein